MADVKENMQKEYAKIAFFLFVWYFMDDRFQTRRFAFYKGD